LDSSREAVSAFVLRWTSSPSATPSLFSTATATPDIYTLSLHDALPISADCAARRPCRRSVRDSRDRGTSRCPPIPAISDATPARDRKSTRLNSSHVEISYAVFCLKKKKIRTQPHRHNTFQLCYLQRLAD